MGELPRYVVDASVVARWFLKAENHRERCLNIREDWLANRIALVAPSHIWYEVPSALTKAVGGARLEAGEAQRLTDLFFDASPPVIHTQDLVRLAVSIAIRLGCTMYDGAYLALADTLECPMLYADNKLRRTLQGKPSRALWIEDYQVLSQN